MPRFSLIVPTIGRTSEMRQLLASLAEQQFSDYELIIVDQNDDDRLQGVMDEFAGRVPLLRIRSAKGCSRARNTGLAIAGGEIIAFPDDDCWYSQGLLKNIDQWFRDHAQYSILAIGALDEAGASSGNRWIQDCCDLHPVNIFRTTFCSALFFSRESLRNTAFDEEIGPGALTIFGAGDETDLVLSIMASGFRGRFDRTWHIGHPRRDMLSNSVSNQRAVSYGCGMGHVLRKHSLWSLWLALAAYDCLRGVAVGLSGRRSAAALCFAHAWGLMQGFRPEPRTGPTTGSISGGMLGTELPISKT